MAYALRYANPRAALAEAESVARLAVASGDSRNLAHALRTAGAARCFLSDLDAAGNDLARAKLIFAELGDELGLAHVQVWRGNVDFRRGNLSRAVRDCLEARHVFRVHGDWEGELTAMHQIGNFYARTRQYGRALEMYCETQMLAERYGAEQHLTLALNNIGTVHGWTQAAHHGLEWFQASARLARKIGDTATEVSALANSGVAWRHIGEHERGIRTLEDALAVCRANGLRRTEMFVLIELATGNAAIGELDRALAYVDAALPIAERSGECIWEIEALCGKGQLLQQMGDLPAAKTVLARALGLAEAGGLVAALCSAHRLLAVSYESEGDTDGALRHYKALDEADARARADEADVRLREFQAVADVERVRYESELRAVSSELQVRKAQMQPHFLLNALNAAAALLHRDADAADAMLVALGDLLRLALVQSSTPDVTVREELAFISLYLEVERFRLGKPLTVHTTVDTDVLDARIPNMVLQPLVENAVRHGIAPSPGPGSLTLTIRATAEGALQLSVADNGVGFPTGSIRATSGIGLSNTRERLRLLFGPHQALEITSRDSGGTTVDLRIPLRFAPGHSRAGVSGPAPSPAAHDTHGIV